MLESCYFYRLDNPRFLLKAFAKHFAVTTRFAEHSLEPFVVGNHFISTKFYRHNLNTLNKIFRSIEKLVVKRGQHYTQTRKVHLEPRKRPSEKIMEAVQIEDDVETFESQDLLAKDQIQQKSMKTADAAEV